MDKYAYPEDYKIAPEGSHSKILNLITAGSKVLEFGPAHGVMTRYLKEMLDCDVTIIEIVETAYEAAVKFATKGYLGDIETSGWVDFLGSEEFDYILFVDVLEHIRNPKETVGRATAFLKEGGHILVSVPNIAHSDIISNLYLNRFEYTPLGLLDDTHIHFFAYSNLRPFVETCGLTIIYEDGVRIPPFYTEQAQFIPVEKRKEINELLRAHRLGSIYQFILDLQKTEYVTAKLIRPDSQLQSEIIDWRGARLYFDRGSGFSQEHSVLIDLDKTAGRLGFFRNLPKDVHRVRFDPISGRSCYLYNLEIRDGRGLLNPTNSNAIFSKDGEYLFSSTDPQIVLDVHPMSTFIDAQFCMVDFSDIEHIHLLESYSNTVVAAEREREALISCEQLLARANAEIEALQLSYSKAEDKIRVSEEDLVKSIEEIASLEKRVREECHTIEEMVHSNSWKITRPLRALGRLLKG